MSVQNFNTTHPALLDLPMQMHEVQTKVNERLLRLAAHQTASAPVKSETTPAPEADNHLLNVVA